MSKTIVYPVMRVHEPLAMEVEVENNRIIDAKVSSYLFRGFELMLERRKALDASLLAQRICGICSSAHALASMKAIEAVWKVGVTPTGRIMRNLLFGADTIQNNLRHFYILVMPDYFLGPDMPPFRPVHKEYFRLPEQVNEVMIQHYWKGQEMARIAHEIMAILGAKAPHQQTIYPTGVSTIIDNTKIIEMESRLEKLQYFIDTIFKEDLEVINYFYPEYNEIGRGVENYLCYGMFELKEDEYLFPGGVFLDGQLEKFVEKQITDEVTYSFYEDHDKELFSDWEVRPQPEKEQAYSWVTTPRYKGKPVEGGSLARKYIRDKKWQPSSVLARLRARQEETAIIVKEMRQWLTLLPEEAKGFGDFQAKGKGIGHGLIDSMRGPLGHWALVEDEQIKKYKIITPSTWNFSPKDAEGQRGPVEEAIVGTPVMNSDHPFEAARIIHAFDPCLSCAVHVLNVKSGQRRSMEL